MAVRHGWVEKFHDDELIVPIPQLGVVLEALRECGVTVGDRGIEENGVLGLARLSGLRGLDKAVSKLMKRHDFVSQQLAAYRRLRGNAHPHRDTPRVSDLALVIQGVKLLLSEKYPGWQIAIGKNYRPSLVRGNPHTDGAGHPKPHTDANGHPKPHTDANGKPVPAAVALAGPIVRPDPHTDIGSRGEGQPTPSGGPSTGPVKQPGPHTDAVRPRDRDRAVRVGLVDTRLFPHESLTDHYVGRAADILSPALPVFTEFDGHCTFVASCILRQAPDAMLYLRPVLDEHGDGTVWEAAAGIADLVPLGLDVVNLSFGEYMTDDDSAPMVLDAAVRRLGPDTVVVAAAGNNGQVNGSRPSDVPPGVTPSTTSYPAALPGVVGVGAVDADSKLAPFTPHPAPWISLLARGVDINAAYLRGDVRLPGSKELTRFDGVANWAGCSFAAGVVSGVIAARTIPGQRTAREALDELVASLRDQPWPGLSINPDLLIK